jgi:hypothetical protein
MMVENVLDQSVRWPKVESLEPKIVDGDFL